MPNLADFKRIAIIQTAFIGDVALSLYLAEAVRHLHPAAQIGFLTTPVSAALVGCAMAVNDVMQFDKRRSQSGLRGILAVARMLGEYDCILSAHRSVRTGLAVGLACPSFSVGFQTAGGTVLGGLLYKARVADRRELHEAERVVELLRAFDDAPDGIFHRAPQPRIHIPEAAQNAASALLQQHGIRPDTPFVAIAPGSVWATKRWREEHFMTLLHTLHERGQQTLLVGGADDAPLCERLSNAAFTPSLAGKTSLPEMMAVLQCASVLVCNDSAPVHLANLVGCRVVGVFGPTVPAFGFAPRGASDAVLAAEELSCRPCSPHGTAQCPLGTHECMWRVRPEQVVAEVMKW
jgi:heptosyltransferase-2